MTTITLPRAVAQQMLEALAIAWQQNPHWQITEGMHALRAALAQQTEPVQEPVGEVLHAWSTEKECIAGTWAHFNVFGKNLPVGTKLYTAPPQRKLVPLTEGEIDALPWFGSPRQFARAVEKASWEKNHGQA